MQEDVKEMDVIARVVRPKSPDRGIGDIKAKLLWVIRKHGQLSVNDAWHRLHEVTGKQTCKTQFYHSIIRLKERGLVEQVAARRTGKRGPPFILLKLTAEGNTVFLDEVARLEAQVALFNS